jgi:hypothetical protein
MQSTMHVYEVRPRKDRRGVDLISVVWRAERDQQRHRIRAAQQPITYAVIRVYDESGNVIETDEHKGDFKE